MSLEDLEAVDRQRRLWLQARAPLRLVDPDADDFSTGGLASRVNEPTVRLLLLPADPDAWLIDFDAAFWAWWTQDGEDPITGEPTQWGYQSLPTDSAGLQAVIVDQGRLTRYLAVHRKGALEFELGDHGAHTYQTAGMKTALRVFRLMTIVGRVSAALRLWTDIRTRLGLNGPAELSLALRDTHAAALGNVAQGWQDPGPEGIGRQCPAKHLFLRRDVWDWPDEVRQLDLAFSIGGWIEDAWGYPERRFLARSGPSAGQFDQSKYRWR
jgi:hypothetical protein